MIKAICLIEAKLKAYNVAVRFILLLSILLIITASDFIWFSSTIIKLIVLSAIMVMCIAALVQLVFQYTNNNQIKPKTEIKAKKYERSVIEINKAKELSIKLVELMESKKLYLKDSLKLDDIATTLGVPKHTVTQVLNEFMNINYYNFVNKYRLEEFQKRLKSDLNNEFTILAHAFDSGFQSKSSFNKAFKEHYNITPSQYREKIVSKQNNLEITNINHFATSNSNALIYRPVTHFNSKYTHNVNSSA